MRWTLGRAVFVAAAMTSYTAVVLLPLGAAFAVALFPDGSLSIEAFKGVLASARSWQLLRNSALLAGLTGVLAGALGGPAGALLGWFRFRGRTTVMALAAALLLTPTYVLASAWVRLVSHSGLLGQAARSLVPEGPALPWLYTLPGSAALLASAFWPIPFFAVAISLRRIDVRGWEAARLCRPNALLSAWWGAVGRLVVPAWVAGSALAALLALLEFAVPSLLQVPVYPLEIYAEFSAFYEVSRAVAMALPLLLLGGLLLAAVYVLARRQKAWLSIGTDQSATSHCPPRASLCVWGLLALSLGLPVSVLVVDSLPWSTYGEMWPAAREELGTSLYVGLWTAALLAGGGFCLAWIYEHMRALRPWLLLSALPFLASGPVVGIGLIVVLNRPWPPAAWLFNHPAVMAMACVGRYAFAAFLGAWVLLRALPRRYGEAAALCGVSWWRRLLFIDAALLGPALGGIAALGFVLALREASAAVLVYPPGHMPIAARVFSLLHYGPSSMASALSVLMTGAAFMASGASTWALQRMARRRHVGG